MSNSPSLQEQLEDFYQSKFGRTLYERETLELSKQLSDCFGYFLVQLGGVQNLSCLESSPIAYHFRCTEEPNFSTHAHFHGDFDGLPLLPKSIDMIFMPHTLEISQSPDAVIQEASTALIPEGLMIIIGFNPLSLFGLAKLIKGDILKKHPLNIKLIRIGRLRRWLEEANCDIDELRTFYFMPPEEEPKEGKMKEIFEILGKSAWSSSGGCYIVVARKRIANFTPVKERWRLSQLFAHKRKVPQPSLWSRRCSKK